MAKNFTTRALSAGFWQVECLEHDGSDRDTLMERHKPLHDQVSTMEKLLCDGLKAGGYTMMNTVNCKWVLSEEGARKWQTAKKAFRQDFPELR